MGEGLARLLVVAADGLTGDTGMQRDNGNAVANDVVQIAGNLRALGLDALLGAVSMLEGNQPGSMFLFGAQRAARTRIDAKRNGGRHQGDRSNRLVAKQIGSRFAVAQPKMGRDREQQKAHDHGSGHMATFGGGIEGGGDRYGQADGRIAKRVVGKEQEHRRHEHGYGVAAAEQHQGAKTNGKRIGDGVRVKAPPLVGAHHQSDDQGNGNPQEQVKQPGRDRMGKLGGMRAFGHERHRVQSSK